MTTLCHSPVRSLRLAAGLSRQASEVAIEKVTTAPPAVGAPHLGIAAKPADQNDFVNAAHEFSVRSCSRFALSKASIAVNLIGEQLALGREGGAIFNGDRDFGFRKKSVANDLIAAADAPFSVRQGEI